MTEATVKTYVSRMLTKLGPDQPHPGGASSRTRPALLDDRAEVRLAGPATGRAVAVGVRTFHRGLAGLPAAHRGRPAGPRAPPRRAGARRQLTPRTADRRPGRPLASARTARSAAARRCSSRTARSPRSRATRTRRSAAAGSARRAARRPSWSPARSGSRRSATARRTRRSGPSSTSTPPWTWSSTGCSTPGDEGWQDVDHNGDVVNRTLGLRQPRRRHPGQRRELPDQEAVHRARRRPDREPGPYLTLLHGPRSGDLVRARRRHQHAAGPGRLGLHRHHGLEHGRGAPGRVPVGDGGQGAGRAGDPRRPALHPDQRAGRHLRRSCGPAPTSPSSAAVVNHILSNDLDFREYVLPYTNAGHDRVRGLRRHRGPGRAVLRLRPGDRRRTTRAPGSTRALEATRGSPAPRPRRRRPGLQHESGGPAIEHGEPPRDDDAAAPALRLADPQAALRALHAGDGRGGLRHRRRSSSSLSPRPGPRTPAGSGPPRSSTRSAGPSTPSACSTSGPRRSSSCCWATWAARAAGSWRCAGTPASRAPPTSRRCSTCCPATWRCRARPRTRSLHDWIAGACAAQNQKGFWRNADAYAVSLLKEYFGDAATAGERLLLRPPAPDHRRPRHVPDHDGHDRRPGLRLLPARPEPGGRLGARPAAAARRWPTWTGWSSGTWR